MAHESNCSCSPNPVVKTTAVIGRPGWVVREYANGVFDAAGPSSAVTSGYGSFAEALVAVQLFR